jgi:hypothetical protein
VNARRIAPASRHALMPLAYSMTGIYAHIAYESKRPSGATEDSSVNNNDWPLIIPYAAVESPNTTRNSESEAITTTPDCPAVLSLAVLDALLL